MGYSSKRGDRVARDGHLLIGFPLNASQCLLCFGDSGWKLAEGIQFSSALTGWPVEGVTEAADNPMFGG